MHALNPVLFMFYFLFLQDYTSLSSYLQQFPPDRFLEAVSDFHLLVFLATSDMIPLNMVIFKFDKLREKYLKYCQLYMYLVHVFPQMHRLLLIVEHHSTITGSSKNRQSRHSISFQEMSGMGDCRRNHGCSWYVIIICKVVCFETLTMCTHVCTLMIIGNCNFNIFLKELLYLTVIY